MRKPRVLRLSLAVMTLLTSGAVAQDWPQFRGPGSRGVAENLNLPDTWSATENVRWKKDIPGRGWSSPVVAGDRVFLTTVVAQKSPEVAAKGLYFGGDRSNTPEDPHAWRVLCLDLKSGDIRWDKVVHEGKPLRPRHIKNSYASETPATDGKNVYALFGDIGLFCMSVEGELRWERRFESYRTNSDWGPAASPVLYRDRVYVVNDNAENSYLVAFDKTTGDEAWRVKRDEKSNWATPFIWENADRPEIITPGTRKFRAYDLDGKLLYEFGGASSITIGTPYTAHGLLYVSSGYVLDNKRPIFAIRPGASGDISLAEKETSNAYIAWSQPQAAPYNPTTIVYGDILYVLRDMGFFAAYDAKTGEVIYDKKRLPNGRAFTASPWAYNDRVFCLNEYGETFVINAGREFEVLHTNSLAEDEMCMATPAIAGDSLLIRTDLRVYCVGK